MLTSGVHVEFAHLHVEEHPHDLQREDEEQNTEERLADCDENTAVDDVDQKFVDHGLRARETATIMPESADHGNSSSKIANDIESLAGANKNVNTADGKVELILLDKYQGGVCNADSFNTLQ